MKMLDYARWKRDIQDGLGIKNMPDLVRKEIQGID